MSARQKAAWTPERREAQATRCRRLWRASHPEQAAIRDQILATAKPEPCDCCASPAAVLFVTDYETGAHIWRCRPCAKASRKGWGRTEP